MKPTALLLWVGVAACSASPESSSDGGTAAPAVDAAGPAADGAGANPDAEGGRADGLPPLPPDQGGVPTDAGPDLASPDPSDVAPTRDAAPETDLASDAGAAPPDAAPPDAAPGPPLAEDSAAVMYGLAVGARWTYLRSGDQLRWKEIVGCEDVYVLDAVTGEPRVERAYVRENRGPFGTTSVHYLVIDEAGVWRIRRDDVDEGSLVVFTTYDPRSLRLLDGPYAAGDLTEFSLTTAEWAAWDASPRGATETSAVDVVLGTPELRTLAGTFQVLGVERQWTANNPHNVQSYYAAGVGEVVEETRWPENPRPQVEKLVDFTPGYARCEPGGPFADAPCAGGLLVCDDAWGTGARGCTDPRVDAANCGICGVTCPTGVCAGGRCVEDACELDCPGTSVCCPMAWNWGGPGCTHPARDRWNCGACGVVCGEGLICDHGACVCGPGTADCGGGECQGLLLDPFNCGACGRVCDRNRPVCDKGICVASCLSVELAECGEDQCVDLSWDDRHCGECGNACGEGNGTNYCNGGTCVSCADAGLTDCDGECKNLEWSDNNCGACGRECGDTEVCVAGACVGGDGTCPQPCEDGQDICCQGVCVNPRTSDHHCGGCGVAECEGGCREACRDGLCVPVDCGGGDD